MFLLWLNKQLKKIRAHCKYTGEVDTIEVFVWLALNVILWLLIDKWWLLDGGKEWFMDKLF